MQQPTGQITRRRRRRRRKGPVGRLLISTDFALLWLKHSMTALCDALFATSLIIWLSSAGHSPLAVGITLAALGAPYALFGPFADAAAERWSRRKTMFVTDVVRGILTTALSLVAFLSRLHLLGPYRLLGITCLLCFVIGVMARFSQAAQRSALNFIVPPSEHARGISRVQGSVTIMTIFGPILAALLFLLPGQNPVPGLLVTSFLLLLSAGGAQAMDRQLTQKVLAIQARQRQRTLGPDDEMPTPDEDADQANDESLSEDGHWTRNVFKAGIEYGVGAIRLVLRERPFGTVAAMMALIAFFGGILNALEVFFVNAYLQRPFAYIGLLISVNAAGVLLGSVWFNRLDAHLRPTLIFAYSVLGLGVTTAGFVATRVFGAALFWTWAMGVMNGLVLFAAQTTLVETGARKHLTRLFAGYDMLTALLGMLGIVLGSVAARGITIGRLLGGASGLLLLVGVLAWVFLGRKAPRATLSEEERAALGQTDESDDEEAADDNQAIYDDEEDEETGADEYHETDQPEYAPPLRRSSQQFGRPLAEQPEPPEQSGGEDTYYQPDTGESSQNGSNSWEPGAPAEPAPPMPHPRTRPRAAPWEQAGQGRSMGLRARFGNQNQDE